MTQRFACRSTMLAALALTSATVQPVQAQPRFRSVGQPGTGWAVNLLGISADGTAVVGSTAAPGGLRAIRWTESEGLHELGTLPNSPAGAHYEALALSGDGLSAFGYGLGGTATSAFRWSAQTGMVQIATLPTDYLFSLPIAVSADGLVTAGWAVSTNTRSYRWTQAGGFQFLGAVGGPNVVANAINNNGSTIVGGSRTGTAAKHAFIWRAQTGIVDLGGLEPCYGSDALGISAGGDLIVGWSSHCNSESQSTATLWDASGPHGLGSLRTYSSAQDITADGAWAVGWSDDGGYPTRVATIWQRGANPAMRELAEFLTIEHGLNLNGWTLREARVISDDGAVIAGQGIDPLGQSRGWVAILSDPVPFVPESCRADFDGDRVVSLADLTIVLSQFGLSGPELPADINRDGLVDLVDLAIALAEFGVVCEP